MQAQELGQSRGLAQMEPAHVLLLQGEEAAEKEEGYLNGAQCRIFDVIDRFPHSDNVVEKHIGVPIPILGRLALIVTARGDCEIHAGLDHDEGAQRCGETVYLGVGAQLGGDHVDEDLSIQDPSRGGHAVEVEVDAVLDGLFAQESGILRIWR